jgi:GT2 family glycosyltransferase
MQSVAIIVLNYNTAVMTDRLADYLSNVLDYPDKKLYVIDNGSSERPASTTHSLPENMGFTRGMHRGYEIARADRSYDAYWFLNSDVGFEYGNQVLRALVEVLFSNPRFGQIAAQMNSPHKFMEQAVASAQLVPYLEPTAPLIKASTIDRVGFWDLDLSFGWGVDYDHGYRIRQAGLANVLTNRARITHKEHQSIAEWNSYVEQASSQMHTVLNRKYGVDWEKIRQLNLPVPVILSCDRNPDLTERFVSSYKTVSYALEQPIIVVDITASAKLSTRYLSLLESLAPRFVFVHSAVPGASMYDSIQDAADIALAVALQEPGELFLFLEDDIEFSAGFADRLRRTELPEDTGFVTFYLPGDGFGDSPFDCNRFYGTQCVLFPRAAVELLVQRRHEMNSTYLPGYDIRWSRFLAANGRLLYATERSFVQHLPALSRLHGHSTHQSRCFVP